MPVKIQVDNALDIADKNREKMKKLPMFDLSYFIGKSYFDGSQNYLMFQPIYNILRWPVEDTETILNWKSKGLSDEIIKSSPAQVNS